MDFIKKQNRNIIWEYDGYSLSCSFYFYFPKTLQKKQQFLKELQDILEFQEKIKGVELTIHNKIRVRKGSEYRYKELEIHYPFWNKFQYKEKTLEFEKQLRNIINSLKNRYFDAQIKDARALSFTNH